MGRCDLLHSASIPPGDSGYSWSSIFSHTSDFPRCQNHLILNFSITTLVQRTFCLRSPSQSAPTPCSLNSFCGNSAFDLFCIHSHLIQVVQDIHHWLMSSSYRNCCCQKDKSVTLIGHVDYESAGQWQMTKSCASPAKVSHLSNEHDQHKESCQMLVDFSVV